MWGRLLLRGRQPPGGYHNGDPWGGAPLHSTPAEVEDQRFRRRLWERTLPEGSVVPRSAEELGAWPVRRLKGFLRWAGASPPPRPPPPAPRDSSSSSALKGGWFPSRAAAWVLPTGFCFGGGIWKGRKNIFL